MFRTRGEEKGGVEVWGIHCNILVFIRCMLQQKNFINFSPDF